MDGEARCPVCGRSAGRAGTQPSCPECGWPLNNELRAGAVSAAVRQEFDSQLTTARKVQAHRDQKALITALGDLIAGLRPDREAQLIDVGLDGIEQVSAYLDVMGSPQVRDG